MVLRKMIKIDESLCDGCGNCVLACPENAIEIIDGKARVVKESLCDGLGACIGECPQGALSIEVREAEEFDEDAVEVVIESARRAPQAGAKVEAEAGGEDEDERGEVPVIGCPAAQMGAGVGRLATSALAKRRIRASGSSAKAEVEAGTEPGAGSAGLPELSNWPVQMRLTHVDAPHFDGASLLIAGDCTAFASPHVHRDFIRGKITLIGCPKLDERKPFVEKLAAILREHDVKDKTVLHMEVPCCSNLEAFVRQALKIAGKDVPVSAHVLGIDGEIRE